MLPLRRMLPLLACALVAGCLDDGASPEAVETMATDGPERLVEIQLGSIKGSSLSGAVYDFSVEVPEGGAQDVSWRLRFEGPANAGSFVEGPGCEASTNANANVVVGVSSSTWGASCEDLPAGVHTFTVQIRGAATSFEAWVEGTVAAPSTA